MNKQTIEVLEILKGGVNNDKWGKALSTAIQYLKAGEGELPDKKKELTGFDTCRKTEFRILGYNEMHGIAKPMIAKITIDRDNLNKRLHILADDYAKAQLRITHLETELERMKGFNHPDSKELTDIKETYKNIIDEKCAGDELHCTCVPALRIRIAELEEVIKTGKCKHIKEDVISAGCSLCHLAWCEARIKVLEQELSQLKDKLSRNNINKITAKAMEDYSVDDYELRGDNEDYSPDEHERLLILDYSIGLVDEIDEAIQKELGV